MKKAKAVVLIILLVPVVILMLNNRRSGAKIYGNLPFKKRLSEYGLFQGQMSDLKPDKGVLLADIASTLFTDYAEKQRLILLPPGKKMVVKSNGLPEYPEGTIIAKTFYYSKGLNKGKPGKIIMETRLLIKHDTLWNATTYIWDERQQEAYLNTDGKSIPVGFLDAKGIKHSTKYLAPVPTVLPATARAKRCSLSDLRHKI